MKLKIFGVVAMLLVVGFCLTSCSSFMEGFNSALESSDLAENLTTENTDHTKIEKKVIASTNEIPYAELFAIYTEAVAHKESHKCDLDISELLQNMLYGEWKNDVGSYINYAYIYENYDNTNGSTWYGTNLPTSQISGNTYYYYVDVKDGDLVIGYQDKLTEDKTDNFVITFKENGISVYNKIDGRTYELKMNENYDKVQKGNAKLAYVYIAKKIFSFKNPGSVKVSSCYVDYETKEVYATIQATNGFGGMTTEDYKLYEIAGSYYISEYSHSYSTNIDLEELNQKLQAYVSTGG